ncbi:MAG TPA: thioredoxin family protein [Anaerolineales bacterium]|nr:thioredoxin family protein [Anaerolineales bacterium]
MAARPIVDGIESEYSGRLLVLRVDVQEAAGKTLARELTVIATPTFIFFDARGAALWRSVGTINHDQVAESLVNSDL